MAQKLGRRAVVGDVAAPLAGDIQLFARLFVALEQHDVRAAVRRFSGRTGRRQSRRAAAYDGYAHAPAHSGRRFIRARDL